MTRPAHCQAFWNVSENMDQISPTGFKALSRSYKDTLTWMDAFWESVCHFQIFTGQERNNKILTHPRKHEISANIPVVWFSYIVVERLYLLALSKLELDMINRISLRNVMRSIPSLQRNLRACLNDRNLQRILGMLLNKCHQAFH